MHISIQLMHTRKMSKKYGLIVPNKKKGVAISSIKKPSVFEDSSSDEEGVANSSMGKAANKSLWRENKKNAMQLESHGSVLKALEEDPNVFEYDSLYEEMQEKKKKSDPRLAKKDKTSKYIGNLKKVADRRKLEQDIIYERKVQREMEQEGTEYGEKDTFLTSAYRQKLEERKKLEEELKMAARREEANDVTKQVDISRFHRTLLHRMTDDSRSPKEESSTEERPKVAPATGRGEEETTAGKEMTSQSSEENSSVTSPRLELAGQDQEETESHNEGVPLGQVGESSLTPPTIDEDAAPPTEDKEVVSSPEKETAPPPSLFPPTEDKELKRKVASAKRTSEESLGSARERYLARKKAKITAPVVSDD